MWFLHMKRALMPKLLGLLTLTVPTYINDVDRDLCYCFMVWIHYYCKLHQIGTYNSTETKYSEPYEKPYISKKKLGFSSDMRCVWM